MPGVFRISDTGPARTEPVQADRAEGRQRRPAWGTCGIHESAEAAHARRPRKEGCGGGAPPGWRHMPSTTPVLAISEARRLIQEASFSARGDRGPLGSPIEAHAGVEMEWLTVST